VLPVTVERNQELSRAAEWLDRAYLCITDASGKRRRNIELLDGRPISELPEAYHIARKEIDEEFRALLLGLQDRVIPDVEAARPDSVEAFAGLGERMLELRKAIYRPGSEFDRRGKGHELLARLGEEHCPPEYKAEIVAAVGEGRTAWREADQAIRGEAAPASPLDTSSKSETADRSAAAYVFQREGQNWRLRFEGRPRVSTKDIRGMGYLNALFRIQRKSIDVLELSASFDPEAEIAGLGSQAQRNLEGLHGDGRGFDEIKPDSKAVCDYRESNLKIQGEIDDAKEKKDHPRRAKLEAEQDLITKELQRGQRRPASNDSETRRKSVSKAITRAIGQISVVEPRLGDHLRKYIQTGAQCSYNPPEEIDWNL